uniref:K-exchanger-like protein n=1 Tax=Arundo donax TaxID=35708 RepID=A0A0A8YGR0_ARUDO
MPPPPSRAPDSWCSSSSFPSSWSRGTTMTARGCFVFLPPQRCHRLPSWTRSKGAAARSCNRCRTTARGAGTWWRTHRARRKGTSTTCGSSTAPSGGRRGWAAPRLRCGCSCSSTSSATRRPCTSARRSRGSPPSCGCRRRSQASRSCPSATARPTCCPV